MPSLRLQPALDSQRHSVWRFRIVGQQQPLAFGKSEVWFQQPLSDTRGGKVELQYGRELGLTWFKDYQAYAFFDGGYVHDLHKLIKQNNHLMTTGLGVRSNFTDRISGFVQVAKQLTKSAAVPGTGESGEAIRVWGGAVLRF